MTVAVAGTGIVLLPVTVLGQSEGSSRELIAILGGPPPPVPPAVLSRDARGRVTGRAVRVSEPLRVDGRLDEPVFATVPSMSGFVQTEPTEGAPATEPTEVWILFDDEQVYFVARCWESRPDLMSVNEMRRDNTNIGVRDNLAWTFDTLYDQRTSAVFEINALGGRMDGQTTTDGPTNFDWNPVWDVEVGQFEGGWTVEAALPFKSIRYRPGRDQIWGFNVRRRNIWKNELTYLAPISAATGASGLRGSLAAPLVGLQAPRGSRNLEIKPYAITDLSSDVVAMPSVANALAGDAGLDVKYGVTQSVTADFTFNTDFAQVEADEQQVNLTRFSLFFPEKREFFLENRATFGFGRGGGDTPILFHSRRIGVQSGGEVSVRGGGRMTGRAGGFDFGLLHIRTGEEGTVEARPTSYSVLRVKRDLLRQSSVGLMVTDRSIALGGAGRNQAYGVDGSFLFLRNTLEVDGYWARTQTDEKDGDDTSYRASVDYGGDRYGFRFEQLAVGDAFNPEIGFVRRDDIRKSSGRLRFSPRLPSVPSIRRLSWQGNVDYIENSDGQVETREENLTFGVEFEKGDRFSLGYRRTYDFLPLPFQISPGVVLPVGGYAFDAARLSYNFGAQRRANANLSIEHGTFFGGHRTVLSFGRGRVKVTPRFAVEPSYSVNWIDLVQGVFTTHLVRSRVIYSMTPKMFASALLQYNSASNTLDTNIRFRWEYQPGSELFVVYNEHRDTLARSFPGLENRALIVKINRIFRF